jgi:hypothetical protein
VHHPGELAAADDADRERPCCRHGPTAYS